jgi:hypothetical protein
LAPAFAQVAPFTEEAAARGIVYPMQPDPQLSGYLGFGCGLVDLDADGDSDAVIIGRTDGMVGLFENDGTGHFVDRSVGSGIPLLTQASALAAADYDGDGRLDLYLTQVGEKNVLARNLGGFLFSNVAAAAGVDDAGAGKGAAWGDYDSDGWLDLYVANYNGIVPGTSLLDNKLYRNRGDGTFEDVSVAQTVDDFGYGFMPVWFDYDRDGDVDLYLSNDRGHLPPLFHGNQLWRNDKGQLVNVSVGSGADLGLFSMGVACGDFDGNLAPDLYCTNVGGYVDGFNPLFLNQGNGTFVESSAPAGVDQYITSWGAIFFDFDNDGIQDLYVNNMMAPNTLYKGTGVFPCIEMAAAAKLEGTAMASFSAAVADIDGDGDFDVLENNLGGNATLYINHEGEKRNFLRLRLHGLAGNKDAVGGRVLARVGTYYQMREVLAGANSYLGQNESVVHFGMGAATVADDVSVRWPAKVATRRLKNVPAGVEWDVWPPTMLGDVDHDGHRTEVDFAAFVAAYKAGAVQPGSEIMDFDGDWDVDFIDYRSFLSRYEGPIQDCDGNGIIDLIDILDGAADNNADAILDACQGPLFTWNTTGAGLAGIHDPGKVFPMSWVSGGIGVGDFDQDGSADLYAVSGGVAPDRLFMNQGDGTFVNESAAWNLTEKHVGTGVAVGDFDSDGDEDVYVTSMGPVAVAPAPGYNKLYRNDGAALGFVDVAAAAGVMTVSATSAMSFGSAFGDYDLDGNLDLFVACWEFQKDGNRLFHNLGNGTFQDVTNAAIGTAVLHDVYGFQPAFVDMDGDLFPELLLSGDFETSRYFVNNGDGTFSDKTVPAGTGKDDNGMGQTVGDFDRDGKLDWYVTSVHSDMPPPLNDTGNMLYRQTGPHQYAEISHAAGVNDGGWGWGTIALDVDQDTWVDLIEVNGREATPPSEWTNEPPKFFRNKGAAVFEQVAEPCGIGRPGSGRAVVYLDMENDGDLDVAVFNNLGPIDMYRNDTATGGAWLQLKLDTSKNHLLAPDGMGARVEVKATGKKLVRFVSGSPSFGGTSQQIVHFGLGDSKKAQKVTITWPRGYQTILKNVDANQRLVIQAPELCDLDGNGKVGFPDVAIVISSLGPVVGSTNLLADVNDDGVVDLTDVQIVTTAVQP